ncbi:MAG: hypothetical protein ACE37B_24810 [Ilumatobacter sp.]|uniref:hypothetical protein n=1 Tax=Ilumatobacter sp. TaxID=1967498 RepID=UPI00391C0FF2
MTNQLTSADLDTTTIAPAPSPTRSTPVVTNDQPTTTQGSGRRWALLAGGVVVAATVGVVLAGDDGDSFQPAVAERSSTAIVQSEIETELARRSAAGAGVERSATAIIQSEIDAALTERSSSVSAGVQLPPYLVIQNEIDAALAERAVRIEASERSAGSIIQSEIDAALADRNAAVAD